MTEHRQGNNVLSDHDQCNSARGNKTRETFEKKKRALEANQDASEHIKESSRPCSGNAHRGIEPHDDVEDPSVDSLPRFTSASL